MVLTDVVDVVTRVLIAVGYLLVPVTLYWLRHQIRSTLWPAALFVAAVAVVWGGWYLVLATTAADTNEFIVGWNRALHIPSFMVNQFLILYVFRRPDAVTRHPEPTDVP